MKLLMTVPPAQAEALFDAHHDYDAQDAVRENYFADLCRCDRTAGQPWRDDEGDDLPALSDPPPYRLPLPAPSFGPAR